jgi:hypothetical protein
MQVIFGSQPQPEFASVHIAVVDVQASGSVIVLVWTVPSVHVQV